MKYNRKIQKINVGIIERKMTEIDKIKITIFFFCLGYYEDVRVEVEEEVEVEVEVIISYIEACDCPLDVMWATKEFSTPLIFPSCSSSLPPSLPSSSHSTLLPFLQNPFHFLLFSPVRLPFHSHVVISLQNLSLHVYFQYFHVFLLAYMSSFFNFWFMFLFSF